MYAIDKFTEDIYIEKEYQLLEYMEQVALKFNPDMGFDDDGNMHPCGTQAIERFKRRYNIGRINVNFKFEDYLHNKEAQATLQELGVDIEKFWYLLLFIMDYTEGSCWNATEIKESPKEQLEKLINLIADNCSDINRVTGATFTSPITITINAKGKQTLTIDHPNTIAYIGILCAKGISDIENDSILSLRYSDFKDTITESDSMRIYLFAKMFLYFFEENKQFNKRQKKGDIISLGKHLLISRLACFTGLTSNKKYSEDESPLKAILKDYSNKELSIANNYYF
ncbi:hypothetical protein ACIXUO_04665 [Bacteroides fragilis]